MFGLKVRQIFFLAVFALLIAAGIQFGSALIPALEFKDAVRQQVKYASRSRRSVDDIRAGVVDKAKEMGIPLQARDVHIQRKGVSFTLDFAFTRPVEMWVY